MAKRNAKHIYTTWGLYNNQTVALNTRKGYIKGWNKRGRPVMIEFTVDEIDDLILQMLALKVRHDNIGHGK